jgi:signal transduction histidine kinase
MRARWVVIGSCLVWFAAMSPETAYPADAPSPAAPAPREFAAAPSHAQPFGPRGAASPLTLGAMHHRVMMLGVGTALSMLMALLFLLALRSTQNRSRDRLGFDAGRAERERIARDLHDTLLQGTQALLFRLQMWQDHPEIPAALQDEIARVVLQTKSLVVESRERILMMRQAPPAELPETLAEIGEEASAGQSAHFAIDVAGEARKLHANTKDQLIHIAREAIRNAYRHAGANRVTVSLRYRRQSLLMSIADDGCGIDPKLLNGAPSSAHFGLTGMRERSKQMGGDFRIQCGPDVGTRIEVTVPAAAAFQDALRWPWQRLALAP